MSVEKARLLQERKMDATFADQRCQEIVNALEHEAVVVGIDGLIYAANEQLAARLGSCTAAQGRTASRRVGSSR